MKRWHNCQNMQPRVRIAIIATILAMAIYILANQLLNIGIGTVASSFGYDHRAYWAAARLLHTGGNPYSRTQMLELEAANGYFESEPLMVWSPPWTLVILLPFSFLPFSISNIVWFITQIICFSICGVILWRYMDPYYNNRSLLGLILALFNIPTMQSLKLGQIGICGLVGITGFLLAIRSKRDILAGAALSLLLIKSHINLLLIVGIGWWIIYEHRWKVLIGSIICFLMMCFAVVIFSPAIFIQYLSAESGLPLDLRVPTLGTWLRIGFGGNNYWLQYLPTIIGLIFVTVFFKYKNYVNLNTLLPELLLMTIILAPFEWSHDMIVLLPVVIAIMSGLEALPLHHRVIIVALYCLSQISMFILNQLSVDNPYYYGFPFLLAGLYLWQRSLHKTNPENDVIA